MSRFWDVFWIDARSESSLDRGFVDIAKKCKIYDESSCGAQSWLQEISHSWLLILDNADNPELNYSILIPAGSNGSILITSRLKECENLETAGKDHYEDLEERTAVELLLKSCGLDVCSVRTYAGEAQIIIELLGCYALAIIQAGASISQGIYNLEDYKDVFTKQRSRLFKIHPR